MTRWIRACHTEDVEAEDIHPFTHEQVDYAIYRSPTDRYYATEGHCTHEQVLLCDGLVMDDVIECPKHNGRFDYTTGAALGPPVKVALKTYPTKVEDGAVFIDVDG